MTAIPTSDSDRRDDSDDREDEYVMYEETEARRSFATSEFWLFIIVSVALLYFTYDSGSDSLSREDGWRYVTAMAVGYFLSRGLAKAGTGEPRVRSRSF